MKAGCRKEQAARDVSNRRINGKSVRIKGKISLLFILSED